MVRKGNHHSMSPLGTTTRRIFGTTVLRVGLMLCIICEVSPFTEGLCDGTSFPSSSMHQLPRRRIYLHLLATKDVERVLHTFLLSCHSDMAYSKHNCLEARDWHSVVIPEQGRYTAAVQGRGQQGWVIVLCNLLHLGVLNVNYVRSEARASFCLVKW